MTTPVQRRVYHPIPAQAIDADVIKVVRRLRRFEHEAYLVGGCVRDLLLGAQPKDFDVATSARPRQVRRLFRNSRVIGRRFQLVHVLFSEGKIMEVATFRRPPRETGEGDLLITDDNVFGTAADDAFRRDFTINALFYDLHSREIVDFVSGLDDIEARLVRSIGDPDVRLREDPVRMLRAIKFAARLGLEIEPELWDAICRHREDISRAAVPRVLEEIFRLFRTGKAVATFELLRDARLLELLLPEVSAWLDVDTEAHNAEYKTILGGFDRACALRSPPPPDAIILAMLLWSPWQATLTSATREAEAAAAQGNGRGRLDVGSCLRDFLAPILTRIRVPRRAQDRIRQVYTAQQRFEPGRRRRKTSSFVERLFFEDALHLLEIRLRAAALAAGEPVADLARVDAWRERAALPRLREKGSPTDAAAPKTRRSRRRRGRRRGNRRRTPKGNA